MLTNKKAFTMMELLVSIVIVGVMAGLAIPAYFRTVEESRHNEAITNLNIIHMGEKIYHLNYATYIAGASIAALDASLQTDMAATFYTTVSVTIAGPNSYTATLTRNNVAGGAGSKWFRYTYTDGNAAPVLTEGGAY